MNGGLGHTEQLLIKLHPDLLAYLRERAAARHQTPAEYIRQMIVSEMLRGEES